MIKAAKLAFPAKEWKEDETGVYFEYKYRVHNEAEQKTGRRYFSLDDPDDTRCKWALFEALIDHDDIIDIYKLNEPCEYQYVVDYQCHRTQSNNAVFGETIEVALIAAAEVVE